jgi:hypothetical protein
MKANRTTVYNREHNRKLTGLQTSAIDLLVSGKNDRETAELLNLCRSTVTKWRLYDPVFQAALNQRRADIWGAGVARLQSLIPRALDILADALEKGLPPARVKAASIILTLAKLPLTAPTGPTDAAQIIEGLVKARINQKHAEDEKYMSREDQLTAMLGPPNRQRMEAEAERARVEILAELESKLHEEEPSKPDP